MTITILINILVKINDNVNNFIQFQLCFYKIPANYYDF